MNPPTNPEAQFKAARVIDGAKGLLHIDKEAITFTFVKRHWRIKPIGGSTRTPFDRMQNFLCISDKNAIVCNDVDGNKYSWYVDAGYGEAAGLASWWWATRLTIGMVTEHARSVMDADR